VGLTAVERAPVLVDASGLAAGRVLDEDLVAEIGRRARALAHPVANAVEVTPAYRRDMVPVFVERALAAAVASAGGGVR
jgi:CO/xanthine dehydrogenase FAD-binding subunit